MKIGFIGSGNMATALLKGFVASGALQSSDIWISNRSPQNLEKWSGTEVNTTLSNIDVCKNSDIIICAVKPNVLPLVLNEIKNDIKEKILVSIAAGVSLETMEALLGDSKIVRAMPNTPAQVGCGTTVLSPNKNITSEEADCVRRLFSSVGSAIILEEKFINAATALHGSSPAYVYMLIDAMADSGVKYGIPKNISLELAAKAVEGAAKMVLETKKHPGELKDAVCSPGGTTIAAVLELEKGGFTSTVSKAIDACVKRADEMSQK